MLHISRSLRSIALRGGAYGDISGTIPSTVDVLHAASASLGPRAWPSIVCSTTPQLLSLSQFSAAACSMSGTTSASPCQLSSTNSACNMLRSNWMHTSRNLSAPDQDATLPANSNPLSPPSIPGSNPLSSIIPGTGEPPVREAVAHLRHIRISPKKLNDFAKVIRKLHVNEALMQCSVSIKKSAGLVHKCLMSARMNAVNNYKLDENWLYVDTAIVGSGAHQKRMDVKARGKTGLRKKYRAHMTVKVRELKEDEANASPRFTKVLSPYLQRGKDKRGTRPKVTQPFVPYFP